VREIVPKEVRWLLTQARPFRGVYVARLSAVLLAGLIVLVDPLLVKWLIDGIIPWRKEQMLIVVAAGFFLVFVFQLGFHALGLILDSYVSQRMMFGIRLRLLRHLQKLPPGFFLETPTGDLLHRLEQDVDQIQELGGNALAALLRIVVITTLTLAIMLVLSWRLTLVIVPLVPLMVLLRRWIYPRLRDAADCTQQANGQRVAFFQDHLLAMPQVQLLGRAAGERRRFAKVGRQALDATVKRRATELLLGYVTNLHFALGNAVVLGLGGYQVLSGVLSVGGLVAFYSYMGRILGPLEGVVTLYSSLQRASASIRRILQLLEVAPTVVDAPRPVHLPRNGPIAVALCGVRFCYREEQPVLDELHLAIHPGEKVALVGVSGCGKSTIARLLTRMYDPEHGCVELDGVDIRDLRLRDLRSRVALVPQDPVLFDVSLKENLLYASPQASDGELRQVLRMAQLEETIQELPKGWKEPVGPRGERLSGGQRQRAALARAVLQNPRLLILDEATSALDGLTERRLLKALDSFVQDRTTILIAHRLSAILWADRIVVLGMGRVVDEGTHPELYRRCDLYRQLCARQLKEEDTMQEGISMERASPRVVAS
jgi:ABC-type multidrug transport system fused ATPase/permease subunit